MFTYENRAYWWVTHPAVEGPIPVIWSHRVGWGDGGVFYDPGHGRPEGQCWKDKRYIPMFDRGIVAIRKWDPECPYSSNGRIEWVGLYRIKNFHHGPRVGGPGDDWIAGELGEKIDVMADANAA
jgi:hypothetical protein